MMKGALAASVKRILMIAARSTRKKAMKSVLE
jgi:hypothetical protein